jgi:hypothetical protein
MKTFPVGFLPMKSKMQRCANTVFPPPVTTLTTPDDFLFQISKAALCHSRGGYLRLHFI